MGKIFKNYSDLIHLNYLTAKLTVMFLEWSSTKCLILCISEIQDKNSTQDPMGKGINILLSEIIVYVDQKCKMATTT
jgi:hypothetical protein